MTWFDGRPEHLWQYPPADEGQRYVECFGGMDGLCDKAETFIEKGDNRFAATLLAHAVAAEPDLPESRPKLLLASVYENLGFGAENATWRNFYLTKAQELRVRKKSGMVAGGQKPLGEKLSVEQWFDIMSVQLDGEKAAETFFTIDFDVTDIKENWRLIVSHGVLTRRRLASSESLKAAKQNPADLDLVLTKMQLLRIIRGEKLNVEKQVGTLEVLEQLLEFIAVQQGSNRGPSQL